MLKSRTMLPSMSIGWMWSREWPVALTQFFLGNSEHGNMAKDEVWNITSWNLCAYLQCKVGVSLAKVWKCGWAVVVIFAWKLLCCRERYCPWRFLYLYMFLKQHMFAILSHKCSECTRRDKSTENVQVLAKMRWCVAWQPRTLQLQLFTLEHLFSSPGWACVEVSLLQQSILLQHSR